MLNSRFCKHEKHPFHLVDPSPWPISTAFAALQFVLGLVTWFHNFTIIATALVLSGFFTLIAFTGMWFKDVITESAFQGHHTKKVVKGLKLGMILFIVSEVLFFFSFF